MGYIGPFCGIVHHLPQQGKGPCRQYTADNPYPEFPSRNQAAQLHHQGHHRWVVKISPGEILCIMPVISLVKKQLGKMALQQVDQEDSCQE